MACKTMNVVIDDRPVYIREWPATVALENINEAFSVIGPEIIPFIEGNQVFPDTLRLISLGKKGEVMPLVRKFVCAARVDGKEISESTFNAEYNGELARVFEVFAAVCRVNYQAFFEQGRSTLTPNPEMEEVE